MRDGEGWVEGVGRMAKDNGIGLGLGLGLGLGSEAFREEPHGEGHRGRRSLVVALFQVLHVDVLATVLRSGVWARLIFNCRSARGGRAAARARAQRD